MKYEILDMRSPVITAFIPLSNLTIKVYDFHIIMYFYLEQIMQNKPKVKSAKNNVSTYITSKYVQHGQLVIQTNKPKQTQFKPKQSQFKPNLSKVQK